MIGCYSLQCTAPPEGFKAEADRYACNEEERRFTLLDNGSYAADLVSLFMGIVQKLRAKLVTDLSV